jgi:hypothetical protein
MPRDIPFDEEVAERDPEDQECFADVRPLEDLQRRRRNWAMLLDLQADGTFNWKLFRTP